MQIFFVEELLYSFVIAVTKVSILIFYLRLFTEPWFRSVSYCMLGITVVYGVAQLLAIILLCAPISFNWTQWDGQHAGKVHPLARQLLVCFATRSAFRT